MKPRIYTKKKNIKTMHGEESKNHKEAMRPYKQRWRNKKESISCYIESIEEKEKMKAPKDLKALSYP